MFTPHARPSVTPRPKLSHLPFFYPMNPPTERNPPNKKIWYDNINIRTRIDQSKLSLMSLNIRSLNKNLDKLKKTISEFPTDIIAVSEIWKPERQFVTIQNYHPPIMKTRPLNKTGGGVGLYISNKLMHEVHEEINTLQLKCIEIIGVKIKSKQQGSITIISAYRPPNSGITETLEDMEAILSTVGNQPTILLGDFNINIANTNPLATKYQDKLLEHNMIQSVKTNTRITSKSRTTIDHVISNLTSIQSIVTHMSLSDHQTIITSYGTKGKNKTKTNNSTKNCQKIDLEKTKINICKHNWSKWMDDHLNTNLNEAYESLHQVIQTSLVRQQLKQRKAKNYPPFYNNEIKLLKESLEKTRKEFLKKPSIQNETRYKEERKDYNKLLKTTKQDYYANKLYHAGKDSKQVWNIIDEVLQRNDPNTDNDTITYEGREVNSRKETANIFSQYFQTAATNKLKDLRKKSNFRKFLPPDEKRQNKFQLQEINNTQTWQFISSLTSKTSSGFDEISPKLVKLCANSLAPPLTLIINKCFKTGSFPQKLKEAKLSPIHKKGEREPCNFRPISELPTFSKIIEKAAHAQLKDYLDSTFEDKYQFAYKKQHSTTQPILLTRELVEKHLNNKEYVLVVLIDLSIAFDCIETEEILPEKLRYYGATDKTVDFFKEFFTGRKHHTNWFGEKSETLNLSNHSCVQGSCLGPPTFNLYTKDLQNVTKSRIVSFADDTNLIVHHKNLDTLIDIGNQELENITDYMSSNYLLINTKKTQAIIFSPQNKSSQDPQHKLTINNQEIKVTKTAQYLGITLDDKLTFKPQINTLIRKLKSATRALVATRTLLNRRAKLLIYNAMFKANLEYGLVTYGDKLNKNQTNELMKLQKKSLRLIFNAKPNVHTKKLYKIANILPADETFKAESIKLVFKNTNELTREAQPKAISELILNKDTARSTRLSNNQSKIQMGSKTPGSLMYKICQSWNESNPEIIACGNYFSLNKTIKTQAIENIEECNKPNCQICRIDNDIDYN